MNEKFFTLAAILASKASFFLANESIRLDQMEDVNSKEHVLVKWENKGVDYTCPDFYDCVISFTTKDGFTFTDAESSDESMMSVVYDLYRQDWTQKISSLKKRLADTPECGWTYSGVYPEQKIQEEIDAYELRIQKLPS